MNRRRRKSTGQWFAALLLLAGTSLFAADPVVDSVSFSQRPGTKLVDITYTVSDADNDDLTISVEGQDGDGAVSMSTLSGDGGSGTVSPGTHTMTWDAGADYAGGFDENFQITLTANDSVYTEDFSADPGFTSLSAEHAYWDEDAGNYRVRTFDNLAQKYWAYSPQFPTVPGNATATIEFDMLCENKDWGTYPSIYLYGAEPTSIDNPTRRLAVSFKWSDDRWKKITIRTGQEGQTYMSSNKFADNVWYQFRLEYRGAQHKGDIEITEKDTGEAFYVVNDVDLTMSDFSFLAVGYYNRPDYGNDWAPIRVDNIVISAQPE